MFTSFNLYLKLIGHFLKPNATLSFFCLILGKGLRFFPPPLLQVVSSKWTVPALVSTTQVCTEQAESCSSISRWVGRLYREIACCLSSSFSCLLMSRCALRKCPLWFWLWCLRSEKVWNCVDGTCWVKAFWGRAVIYKFDAKGLCYVRERVSS